MQIRAFAVIQLAALFAAFLVSSAEAQDKPIKIGYVDLKRVYEESGKKEKYHSRMEEIRREKKLVLIEMREKISAMEKIVLELSDEKRREKEREITEKKLELNRYIDSAEKDIKRKSIEFEKEFAGELREIVIKIGDDEGYTYILSDIVILYSDPKYDLTDKVIAGFKEDKTTGKSSSKDK